MWLVLLVLFWLVLAGAWSWQVVLAAVVAAVLVVASNRDSLLKPQEIPGMNGRGLRLWLIYVLRFVLELFKANVQVAKIVLSPRLRIAPRVIHFPTRIQSEVGRVVLATTISLTPGTLTLHVTRDSLWVHALTKEAADGVQGWIMEELLLQIEATGKVDGGWMNCS